MRLNATVYKGIEFINVSELPADQQLMLKYSQQPERIKILVGNTLLSDCIQYKVYRNWYHDIFVRSVSSVPIIQPVEVFSLRISLGKAS